jgi:pyridoxal phosphate enzyme (YggS family)
VTRITEQLAGLQSRIRNAAERAGRNNDSVTLLAVSKKQPIEAILEARSAGLLDFGENYVQEGLKKIAESEAPDIRWHFIGSIQSNKTRPIAENFTWVHTVDSARVARRLSAHRPQKLGILEACIQIRAKNADNRAGIPGEEVFPLADTMQELPNIRLRGLMMMPLPGLSADEIRREFARTRDLLRRLVQRGHDVDTLSMGMSADLEAAIMEGSTIVRIGTDLFGPRPL